jgi:hypothetical protein
MYVHIALDEASNVSECGKGCLEVFPINSFLQTWQHSESIDWGDTLRRQLRRRSVK